MQGLTQRQSQALQCIIDTIHTKGYPPTLREIGREMDIRSTNGVSDHLKALHRKGYIHISGNSASRGIKVLYDPLGFPSLGLGAQQRIEELERVVVKQGLEIARLRARLPKCGCEV